MNKNLIRTSKDLDKIQSEMNDRMSLRAMHGEKNSSANGQFDVMLCMGTSCISSGAGRNKNCPGN